MVECKDCIAFNAIPVNGKFCALNFKNKMRNNIVIPEGKCPKPVSYNEYYVVRSKLITI